MIDGIFSQPTYLVAKKMLDAAVVRQDALASNIANLEKPGYKRVDLAPSFNQQLQRATANRDIERIKGLRPTISVDSTAQALSLDGNTVSLENEMTQAQQNLIQHSLSTQLITGSLLRLRLAITGRPI
ncbi:MAG: flagellar basal body rod protein FlgB [Verrucomicrobia bacterium]|nr:flagellar basal body rod protein FlgB [Verrucomicrobiota bacterium]